MIKIDKEFLVGVWTHEEWQCELTMFNFLTIKWPNSSKASGAWILRDNEVILTYHLEKTGKRIYIFSIEEVIDDNTLKTKDLEKNKEEILRRVN